MMKMWNTLIFTEGNGYNLRRNAQGLDYEKAGVIRQKEFRSNVYQSGVGSRSDCIYITRYAKK